jgi:DNA gyrase/topoisomerase IV subunit B|tara:strand:- start:4070 stop:5923 length:1854 start_codon:yes stop_codon:yes gene_type:complete
MVVDMENTNLTKQNEQFRILTARQHVRERIGMYMGSSSKEEIERFVLGEWTKATYVPALSKMVDEILDNSIDEAIRTNFKFANKINVSINSNEITVTDNGRGIPQDKIFDEAMQTNILRPVAAWTKVNAGTSFDDERVTIGTNGVGSAATNFLSKTFTGKTWSNKKSIQLDCKDGADTMKVKTGSKVGNGTEVSFIPDFDLFEVDSLDQLDTITLIEDRLISLQMAFPEIQFSFNKKKVAINDFKKYVAMFSDISIMEKTNNLSYFIAPSEDGFRTNSYINGVNTRQGGTYVDYFMNQIIDTLTVKIKRRHKVEVLKTTIKSGITFVMFARNFVNPKFDSQTKERLTNPFGNVKEHLDICRVRDAEWLANKILNTPEIIDPIIEAQLAKKAAADKRAATLAQKKLRKVKVAKHISANKDDATLKIVEGDSAMGFLLKVRDPDTVGAFPLRGVIMNTWDMKPAEVLKNKELSELVAVLGLDINDKDSVDNMTYKYIATLTDADHDGIGHISPLLIAFFYKFWPRLLLENRVQITRTPIMISTKGSEVKWMYTYEEAAEFKKKDGYKHRYIKGLGSLTEDEYHVIINKPMYDTVTVDDASVFQMMFGKDSSLRKEYMFA